MHRLTPSHAGVMIAPMRFARPRETLLEDVMTADTLARSREWVERARELAPLVERFRDEGEAERRLPKPVADAMRKAGLFSLWLPVQLGGPGVSIETSVLVTEELSRQDGSVGWNSMIAGNTSVLWAFISPAAGAGCIKG